VTTIGDDAFAGTAWFDALPDGLVYVGRVLYVYKEEIPANTAINIKEGTVSITSSAFFWRTGLTSVTIPNSVTAIGDHAFYDCTGLTEIHNKKAVPQSIDSYVFWGVNKTTCKLYVPTGSVDAYRNADGWKEFLNIIEEDGTAINTISNSNVSILSTTNGIAIITKEAAPVVIFNLSGQQVYQAVIQGSAEIALSKGVYIVQAGKESHKVIVR
jgi:hypothetical protein